MTEEMNTLVKINYEKEYPTVVGRELHKALQIETPYSKWFERMTKYGFTENVDYWSYIAESTGGRRATEHLVKVSMAKELCMLQRTEIGQAIRKYFISIEDAWNNPEAVMARALQIAKIQLTRLEEQCCIMKPKADYYDRFVDSKAYTGITETAKELGVQPKVFVQYLLDNKYLYRTGKAKRLCPYANQIQNGIFVIKEFVNAKNNFTSTQTFITAKGREVFSLVFCQQCDKV